MEWHVPTILIPMPPRLYKNDNNVRNGKIAIFGIFIHLENKTSHEYGKGSIVCAKLAPASSNIREILEFQSHFDLRWSCPLLILIDWLFQGYD